MKTDNIANFASRQENKDLLTELIREGAQKLIKQAVEDELKLLLDQYSGQSTEDGTKAVIRNGYLPERELQTGVGPVKVKIPKIRSKCGESVKFNSMLVPPYIRKSKSLEAALPWLYLKGISTGDMEDALRVLLGNNVQGLSASTISNLKNMWGREYEDWKREPLSSSQWVYVWADGIYSGLRGEESKLCCLVVIGVNDKGEKKFLAIEDGVRESTQSWREVLLNLKSRGMSRPKLAIGDGAMGFWSALEEIYPEAQHQRCWMHKTGNVLNYMPKSVQAKAKSALHDIWQADTKENANVAFDLFIQSYEAKYPKAVNCLIKDRDSLMTFYDFPAEHWQSIRTSNPIESTFGTIRHRTIRSKGCLSRDGMLHMIFKLGKSAEENWRKLRGFSFLGKVIIGVQFRNGIEVTKNQVAA